MSLDRWLLRIQGPLDSALCLNAQVTESTLNRVRGSFCRRFPTSTSPLRRPFTAALGICAPLPLCGLAHIRAPLNKRILAQRDREPNPGAQSAKMALPPEHSNTHSKSYSQDRPLWRTSDPAARFAPADVPIRTVFKCIVSPSVLSRAAMPGDINLPPPLTGAALMETRASTFRRGRARSGSEGGRAG